MHCLGLLHLGGLADLNESVKIPRVWGAFLFSCECARVFWAKRTLTLEVCAVRVIGQVRLGGVAEEGMWVMRKAISDLLYFAMRGEMG
jgi:hypothetical protein